MNKYMTATQGRKNFYTMLKVIQKPDTAIIITYEGEPKGVFMSFEQFEGWQETFDIMSDPELSKSLIRDLEQMRKGTLKTIPYEKARKQLKL